jgi:hypothetical protein
MHDLSQQPAYKNIAVDRLRPTQFTVGMRQVKQKRKQLKELERRPGEMVEFILCHPIRVVLGPAQKAYVIDHHHLALALLKEGFETAPMHIEEDLSQLSTSEFWTSMQSRSFVHLVDAHGQSQPLDELPRKLVSLKDDPYRALAGFVREAAGFAKVKAPYAEFQWADFFRSRITKKIVKSEFAKAVQQAIELSKEKEAAGLPGFLGDVR